MKQSVFIKQLAEYFEVFLPQYCRPNTIDAYSDSFAVLFSFFHEQKGLAHHLIEYKDFTPAMFDEFVLWMGYKQCYSSSTKKQRMSAIASFMKYASRRDMRALAALNNTMHAAKPKVPTTVFPYFTVQEMKILAYLPSPQKRLGSRDRVLLALLYDSAARAQEICDLRIGDIRFGSPTKARLTGKGQKIREVPISAEVSNLLKSYLKSADIADKDRDMPLFSSQTNTKMTPACIRSIVKKYVNMGKQQHQELFLEPKYSPHSFRHSKAIHMAESGVSLIYIRNFLGHVSVQSTECYAKVGQAAVTKALTERKLPVVSPEPLPQQKNVPTRPDFLRTARK